MSASGPPRAIPAVIANEPIDVARSPKNSEASMAAVYKTVTLANSEGWMRSGPTLSQRVAPLAPDPATKTTTSMPIVTTQRNSSTGLEQML